MLSYTLSQRTLHFLRPATTSRGTYTTRLSHYVAQRDTDRPAVVGIGECATLPDLSSDAHPDYDAILDGECRHLCQTGQLDYDRLRPYPSILFGLETALAHLNAGSTALYDTPFARGEEGIPINGLVWMGTYDEMRDRLEDKLNAGYHCVKLKIGAIDFNQELDLIRRIRSEFSQDVVELRLDANGAFSPAEAPKRLEALARYDIHSVEQPIRQGQWHEMATLCQNTPLPIALDEELIGINDTETKTNLLETIRPQYIILKPSLHGGLSGAREWIDLAQQRNINSWITSALESNVGLNAIAHFTALTYGPSITHHQGLGTGQLFADNIAMPLEIRGQHLHYIPNK